MKVISRGVKWFAKKTCKGCQAVLGIEEEDIDYVVTDEDARTQQYSPSIEGTYFVMCPECGQLLKIKPDDIPTPIKESIRQAQS